MDKRRYHPAPLLLSCCIVVSCSSGSCCHWCAVVVIVVFSKYQYSFSQVLLKFLDGDTSSIDGDLRMSTTLRWESGDRKAKLNVRKEVIKEWVLLRDAKYNSVILI